MTNEPWAEPAEQQQPDVDEFFMLCMIAMRLALEYDGAPARCRDRACRATGRCHLVAKEDGPFCHAGIPGSVAEQAGLMLAFDTELRDLSAS